MDFEWDETKAAANLGKHGIAFEYAVRAFDDPDALDFDVSRVADSENRRKIVGMIEEKMFTVVYVMRKGACRIISARRSNRAEERAYGDHPICS